MTGEQLYELWREVWREMLVTLTAWDDLDDDDERNAWADLAEKLAPARQERAQGGPPPPTPGGEYVARPVDRVADFGGYAHHEECAGGPSEAAITAAQRAAFPNDDSASPHPAVLRAAKAAHDPALGPDRSICLREILDFLDDLPDAGDLRIAAHLIEVRTLLRERFSDQPKCGACDGAGSVPISDEMGDDGGYRPCYECGGTGFERGKPGRRWPG